jgi:hypothetical protein
VVCDQRHYVNRAADIRLSIEDRNGSCSVSVAAVRLETS